MSTAWLPYPANQLSSSANDLYIVGKVNGLSIEKRFKPSEDVFNVFDNYGVSQFTQSKDKFLKALYTEEADDLCLEICVPLNHVSSINIVNELNSLGFSVDGSEITSCTILGFIETSEVLYVSWSCADILLEQMHFLPNNANMKLEQLSKQFDITNVLEKFFNFHCYCNEF